MNPNNGFQFRPPSSATSTNRVATPFISDYGTTGQPQDRIMTNNFPTGGREIPLSLARSTFGGSTNKPQVNSYAYSSREQSPA
jgi:hypothetical protein